MPLFLLIFFSVYGTMHAYLFWKVCAAFGRLGKGRWVLAAFMVLMIVAPVLVRMLDRWRWLRLANVVAVLGYSWLAVVFWFCILAAAADLWNLAVRGAVLIAPTARSALLPARPMLAASAAVIIAAFCWGLVEAANIRVRHVTLRASHLPANMKKLKLLQIADLHLGVHTSKRKLAGVVELIKQVDPDIVVSTGDLVDASFHYVSSMSDLLKDVRPRFGKYAVLGNHEFYAGLTDSLAFHEAAGFRLLRGESVEIGGGLRIAGVDDRARGRTGQGAAADEEAALPGEGDDSFVILLKHQPRVRQASLGRFDLQLSGHTHGGQVFPWHFITRLSYGFVSGLHRLGGRSALYVSCGTGTWGPPIRVFAPPEITAITLEAPRD